MEYSAGFTKESWSEKEMAIVIELILKGMNRQEIVDHVLRMNLFQLRSSASVLNRFQMVYRRSKLLDDHLKELFLSANDLDRKALVLLSFLKAYRFPKEFFYEVLVNKYNENKKLLKSDISYYFEKKGMESEKVKGWRPDTVKRLTNSIILFFRESGMLKVVNKQEYEIIPLYISKNLKSYAENQNFLLREFSVLGR